MIVAGFEQITNLPHSGRDHALCPVLTVIMLPRSWSNQLRRPVPAGRRLRHPGPVDQRVPGKVGDALRRLGQHRRRRRLAGRRRRPRDRRRRDDHPHGHRRHRPRPGRGPDRAMCPVPRAPHQPGPSLLPGHCALSCPSCPSRLARTRVCTRRGIHAGRDGTMRRSTQRQSRDAPAGQITSTGVSWSRA